MPRGPRLDAPGVVHHVMVRGLEERETFGHVDRADFIGRLARLLPETQTACLAWCVLPNQIHLVLRSGPRGLQYLMRRLLTGYAVAFNHRHDRVGHVFENRYQSIACEEDSFLPALVRHVHLTPVRAGLVTGLDALAGDPWCGHGALLGNTEHPWQETAEVLGRFGDAPDRARLAYQAFVAEGADTGEALTPKTGTAERLAAEVGAEDQPRAATKAVWGSLEFVEGLRAQTARETTPQMSCRAVVEAVCRALGLSPHALASRRRTRPLSNGRAVVAYVARTRFRIAGAELAQALGMSPAGVTLAERRGEQLVKRRVDLKSGLRELLN